MNKATKEHTYMSDYKWNQKNYSGIYTNSERNWLTLLRYSGFLLFGAGIYGIVANKFHVLLSFAFIILAVVLTSINVGIMKKGIERRKACSSKGQGHKKRR